MRVSYRWLRELVPGLDASAAEVGRRLTSGGLEVEGSRDLGGGLGGVVIARVVKAEPHPSRERLRLVTVDLGQGKEERVVCGASNVPGSGGHVVFAPIGTHLPAAGITLERRPIGGVESAGMLVSEAELGLAESSEGILVPSPADGAPGTPLERVVPSAYDTIYEIGVTPNRPDALGHLGVARDLAALFDLPFVPPPATAPERVSELSIDALVTVRLEEPERCPVYGAAVVDEVTIGPSPAWLRYRLHLLGVRPVSNVVDVTNLLLLEYGQPMHAFDYDLVAEKTIIVRRATAGEPFTTLDGTARRLDPDDLVIADPSGPSALAGVMGGARSEIRAGTGRVLLECAYFTPRGIRRTSRRHGLSTESSYRFERGVDFGAVPAVLERAKALLSGLAGGAAVRGAVIARGAPLSVPAMRLRSRRLNGLLGMDVPFDEARAVLGRLGFGVSAIREETEGPVIEVTGASFRPDVSMETDLIEEVARIRGFDRIPTVLPAVKPEAPRATGKVERAALEAAVSLGLSEAITYSFVSEKDLALGHAPPPVVRLLNPMTEDRHVLRTSLLVGLFEVVRRARRRGEREARLFTIGACFLPPSNTSEDPVRGRAGDERRLLPEERASFAAVLAGPRPTHLVKPDDVDVFDAIGLAVELLERLTGRAVRVEAMAASERSAYLHPRGAAWLSVEGARVGRLGPVHPEVADAFDLGGPAQVVEIDLADVERLGRKAPAYRPIPRLPPVTRDVALVVSEAVPAASVEAAIRSAAGELCESIELFDLFRGGSVPEGRRSLAYRLVYRDPKATRDAEGARTLTDEEVDRRHEKVRAAAKELGELRE